MPFSPQAKSAFGFSVEVQINHETPSLFPTSANPVKQDQLYNLDRTIGLKIAIYSGLDQTGLSQFR